MSVDVDRVMDSAKLRGPALLVVICAASTLILDGFDIQAAGFAAPALVGDLNVERAALGPALAASLVGMAIGAASIGPLGDLWGRRRTLILSTVLFGAATLLAATSTGVPTLALWRFITGIGLGGALTSATALIAEFSPRRFRPQTMGVVQVGVPVGGMLGAMLAALLSRIDPAGRYSADDEFVLGEELSTSRSGVRALFSPQLRWDTVIVSLAFLTNMFAVYAFFSWAPLVLTSLGFELKTAVRGALVINVAGVVGVLACSWLIARFGSRRPLAVFAVAGAGALAWLAFRNAAGGFPALLGGIAVAGAGVSAVQVGLYTLAAHVFPTECRTTGIGWVLGTGRFGGVASALGGGLMLTLTGADGFFGLIAAVLSLTFVAVLLVRRQIVTASRPLPAPGPGTAESSARDTRTSGGSLRTPDPSYRPHR